MAQNKAKKKITKKAAKKTDSKVKKDPYSLYSVDEITDEAMIVVIKYLDAMTISYEAIDMTKREISEAIDEIKDNLIQLARINSKDGVISTDDIKKVVSKLGDPSAVKEIISGDGSTPKIDHLIVDFNEQDYTLKLGTKGSNIKVSHVSTIYWLITWSLVSSIIFLIFGFEDARIVGSAVFVVALLFRYLISAKPIYAKNSFLQEGTKLNWVILLFPLIYFPLNFLYLNNSASFMDPFMLTLWLILMQSKDGQDFIKNEIKALQKLSQN